MNDRKRQDMQDKIQDIYIFIMLIMPLAIIRILFWCSVLRISVLIAQVDFQLFQARRAKIPAFQAFSN